MITRPQAEALLTLAEALEACERVGANVTVNVDEDVLGVSAYLTKVEQLAAVELRLAISAAVPKSTGS